MSSSMRPRTRNPFDSAATAIVLCLLVGAILGALYGAQESQLMAEQISKYQPGNPFDGLRHVIIGYTGIGVVIGTLIGGLIAIQRYYKTRA